MEYCAFVRVPRLPDDLMALSGYLSWIYLFVNLVKNTVRTIVIMTRSVIEVNVSSLMENRKNVLTDMHNSNGIAEPVNPRLVGIEDSGSLIAYPTQ